MKLKKKSEKKEYKEKDKQKSLRIQFIEQGMRKQINVYHVVICKLLNVFIKKKS